MDLEYYKRKYFKYKTKYLELKREHQQTGGDKNIVIHIAGPSGSGKTTLGSKLKEQFGDEIIVTDTDDLRDEFIRTHYGDKEFDIIDKDAYQAYIDQHIHDQTKPLVFVGLTILPWFHKNHYYDMHSDYNFYISIDNDIIVRQRCLRSFEDLKNDKIAVSDIINNNDRFVRNVKDAIDRDCGMKNILKEITKWNRDYKSKGYEFMSREDIFTEVSKILQTHIKN